MISSTPPMLSPAHPLMTVTELAAALAQPQPPDLPALFVLDVREPAEWQQCHIAHPAVHHMPMGQLENRLETLPQRATIAVLCKSGGRSARVTAFLSALGFQARNVTGGMQAWVTEIDPSLPQP